MEFSGKVALVTGGTAGIGAEVARALASKGATVIITGRDAQRGGVVVAELEAAGHEASFIQADLTDTADIAALLTSAGPIDILINNAAVFPIAGTVDQDADGLDHAFAANVRAPYLLAAGVVPGMIAKGSGAIVNVSTMAASIGMPGLSVYSATKAALESLTRTWAAEFGAAGIRVNAVAPGPTATDMVMNTMGEEGAAQVASTTVLQRLATPKEIAGVVAFAASDAASYLTGAVIAADGGRTAI